MTSCSNCLHFCQDFCHFCENDDLLVYYRQCLIHRYSFQAFICLFRLLLIRFCFDSKVKVMSTPEMGNQDFFWRQRKIFYSEVCLWYLSNYTFIEYFYDSKLNSHWKKCGEPIQRVDDSLKMKQSHLEIFIWWSFSYVLPHSGIWTPGNCSLLGEYMIWPW